jgi:hypothetical protein
LWDRQDTWRGIGLIHAGRIEDYEQGRVDTWEVVLKIRWSIGWVKVAHSRLVAIFSGDASIVSQV